MFEIHGTFDLNDLIRFQYFHTLRRTWPVAVFVALILILIAPLGALAIILGVMPCRNAKKALIAQGGYLLHSGSRNTLWLPLGRSGATRAEIMPAVRAGGPVDTLLAGAIGFWRLPCGSAVKGRCGPPLASARAVWAGRGTQPIVVT